MIIKYQYYEPNKGLEEQQAKIYTEAAEIPVTAEEIKARYESEKIDPKTVRYALTEDGKMLAYVQARDYPAVEETHIGYPWALPECPVETQEKIFDELLAYIKQREATLKIRAGAGLEQESNIEFFKKRGLVEVERGYEYFVDMNVEEASKMEKDDVDRRFTSRVASENDLNLLLQIAKSDPNSRNAFPSDDEWISYFKDKVLNDGHAVLVFQDDQVVCASAPLRFKPDGRVLRGEKEKIIFRFQATRPGYAHAWKTLVIGIAKECLAAGWKDIPLLARFYFTSESPVAMFLAESQSDIVANGIRFGPLKK